ncbi:MAG TPA: NAD-dependent epimerase/dehydratase family protein [Pyrinomonadaceae bacterium]
MKVLVTGGSGYLGSHVRRFFDADDFSRRSHLDILDENDLGLISSYDLVIHLAAHLDKSPDSARQCFSVNAEGTANVLRHISAGAVLIYASTKDVYGPHADSYVEVSEECSVEYAGQTALEWSKLIGERYVDYYARRNNFRSCILRMSAVYARPSDGNQSGFVTHYVESVKRGWPIRLPLGGSPVRDILHVDDFARACEAFARSERRHGLYNLGGGKRNSASLREIIETVGRMIQLDPVIVENDAAPHPVPINYISDLSRIRDQLGWQPEIGLEDGLRMLL